MFAILFIMTLSGGATLLYVNKGPDKEGIPRFTESAADYGLISMFNRPWQVFLIMTMIGDLDMYLTGE
jgi:hypothetical protein